MIKSNYIIDIFDLAFDDYKSGELLRNQIEFLTINKIEHTGVGIIIDFNKDPEIFKFKADTDKGSNILDNGDYVDILNGVEIENKDENILADATVYIKNGFIDGIDIWNKIGNYPVKELERYEMRQSWRNIDERRTIKR